MRVGFRTTPIWIGEKSDSVSDGFKNRPAIGDAIPLCALVNEADDGDTASHLERVATAELLCVVEFYMAQNQRVPSKPSVILAAKYVRMSTEHQQYSIDNQTDAISRYAREHNMEIVRTYIDSGKSGLTIQHRPGLRQLIAEVEGGSAGYAAILVYDVSRWGRFQDVDESAYYEYRCRRAKIKGLGMVLHDHRLCPLPESCSRQGQRRFIETAS